MSWLLALLLLAPDPAADLRRALGGVPRDGLSILVGGAGAAPMLAVAPDTPRIPASNAKLVTAAAAADGSMASDLLPLIMDEITGSDSSAQVAIAWLRLTPPPPEPEPEVGGGWFSARPSAEPATGPEPEEAENSSCDASDP